MEVGEPFFSCVGERGVNLSIIVCQQLILGQKHDEGWGPQVNLDAMGLGMHTVKVKGLWKNSLIGMLQAIIYFS